MTRTPVKIVFCLTNFIIVKKNHINRYLNAIFNIPMINLCHNIGIPAYYGATINTILIEALACLVLLIYLKNMFYPLIVPDTINLQDGQMVIVRTEKGEEALRAFTVNTQISSQWENAKTKTEPLTVVRTLSQRDIQTLDDIKKEEVIYKNYEKDKFVNYYIFSIFGFSKLFSIKNNKTIL